MHCLMLHDITWKTKCSNLITLMIYLFLIINSVFIIIIRIANY